MNAWQDGQIKPRLDTETEQRAESSYRTPEEEYALQSQLAKHFTEEQQAETGGVYDRATVQQAAVAQQRQAEVSELTNRLRNAWTEITEIEQGTHGVPYAEQELRKMRVIISCAKRSTSLIKH